MFLDFLTLLLLLTVWWNYQFFSLSLPNSITFFWNNGSSLSLVLSHQVVSGLFLTIHFTYSFDGLIDYVRNVFFSFNLRFFHANSASLFLFLIFLHFFRSLYFSSFNNTHLWISGSVLLLLSMGASFLGYVLPYSQMSYWSATVIVNLISVIPLIGPSVCILVWSAYTVNLYTLNRFFTFHFLLPFVILILVFGHILTLHLTGSNSNLSSISRNSFFKLFLIKDLISWIFYFLLLFTLSHLIINLLSDVENFLEANSLVTPLHIKPEWYFLFAYSILRCIPSNTIGVLALLFSVLFPVTIVFSVGKSNNSNLALFLFFFVLLTITGSMPVEAPYVLIAQVISISYFLSYLS